MGQVHPAKRSLEEMKADLDAYSGRFEPHQRGRKAERVKTRAETNLQTVLFLTFNPGLRRASGLLPISR